MTDFLPSSAPARSAPKDGRRELEAAVGLAIDSFARCFNDMFPRIEEELFASAGREPDRTRQSHILDAYSLIRTNRDRIEREFRHSIETIVQERLSPPAKPTPDYARKTADSKGFSLVDESEVEADLIIKRLVARLRQSGTEQTQHEIHELDDRLSYLLGKEEIGDAENPFSPDALARAVQKAFRDLAAEQAVQVEVLRTFENFAAEGFGPAYHALNEHLVQRNVLPDIDNYRRARYAAHRGRPASSGEAVPGPAQTQPRGGFDQTQARPREGLLDKFSRYRATQPALANRNTEGTPDTFWPVITRSVVEYLPTLVPTGTTVAAAMAGLVNVPLSDLNLLHQVRDNARRLGAPRDEEILIDLVAVLVDKILQDRQVPERIKRLIARLQVPLVKAALLDKALFATKEHPARVLLDAIARTAIGWNEDNDTDGRYYQLIYEVVTTVESKFDRDVAIFSVQAEKVDAFAAAEAARESRRYERAAALLQQVERRELADVQALEQIRDAVAQIQLPEELTEFLLDPWRCVIVDATVAGASQATLDAFRRVITDLVWSVQPKVTAPERQDLVTRLPDLLKRIRGGLTTISMPAPDQESFFSELMQMHSAAVKIGVRTEMQDRAFQKFESRVEDLHIDPDAAPDLPVQISPESLKASVAAAPVEVSVAGQSGELPKQRLTRPARMTRDYIDDMMSRMAKGVWVEFVQGAAVKVAQLRWISPRKSMYLFTDRLGKAAITYTPELLRVQIADGLLSLLDPQDLTDRVINALDESIGAMV